MIKTVLYIIIFSGFANANNFIKSEKHVTSSNEKLVHQNDPLKIFIQSLAKSPLIKIPYGSKNVLYKFSPEWDMPDNKNISQDNTTQSLQSNYNSLDSFFYADIEKRSQLNVEAKSIVVQRIASTNFVKLDEDLQKNKKIMAKVSSLVFSNSFKTYSIIVSGKQRCNTCEFPNTQTENILINVDTENNIIDKLVLSSIVGSDLGGSSKFFYIDANKIIHIKEFYSDELTAGFKKYKKYKVMPDGHFIENTKK
jgi:hypothetical protein